MANLWTNQSNRLNTYVNTAANRYLRSHVTYWKNMYKIKEARSWLTIVVMGLISCFLRHELLISILTLGSRIGFNLIAYYLQSTSTMIFPIISLFFKFNLLFDVKGKKEYRSGFFCVWISTPLGPIRRSSLDVFWNSQVVKSNVLLVLLFAGLRIPWSRVVCR